MKWILTILLFMNIAKAQSLTWTTNNEAAVAKYLVENSKDTLNWNTYAVIIPGDSIYTLPIPDSAQFWRVRATGLAEFSTEIKLYQTGTSVILSTWGLTSYNKYVNVYWASQGENNLNSYTVDRSYDAINFTQVAAVLAKGNSNYTVNINRPITTSGFWWWRKTVIDQRKGIYRINAITNQNIKSLLKTVSE